MMHFEVKSDAALRMIYDHACINEMKDSDWMVYFLNFSSQVEIANIIGCSRCMVQNRIKGLLCLPG